jgi:hypothetical protein
MHGKKKKSIEEMETEVEELITKSGQSKDNIHTNYNAYLALKKRIDNPDSCHDDEDIRWMKYLHNVFLLGMAIRRKKNKINATRKVAVAAAAAAAAIATSNIVNISISSYATLVDSFASTSINGNKITVSFESTPPPSSDPSTTSSLPSSSDETRASLDINSLSDQSSILASHSKNKITASFEANASFALSTSHSNASDSPIVGAQLSKCPWLASQQSDAVVDLSSKCSIWRPHHRLLSGNVAIMDVPGDGNCLFYACISKLQSCMSFMIERASIMRNNFLDYLLLHADEDLSVSGDSMSLTWSNLSMMHASEIQTELRHKGFSQDANAIISTLERYAHYMSCQCE